MPTIEEMSLDELEATMSQLRERRRLLKKSGKVAERKIATLARRRARLMEQVSELDAQIEAMRHEASLESAPAPRRRGRRPKSAIALA
ncbi:MAG TPA: hypothetical protein VGL77_06865 [Armatimonadota bacterium]|jgi:chromosome segregation ATPase